MSELSICRLCKCRIVIPGLMGRDEIRKVLVEKGGCNCQCHLLDWHHFGGAVDKIE